MARVGGQSPVRGSFVRRPSVPWCWGIRWLKGVSSTLEAEQCSPRPASSRPQIPGFAYFWSVSRVRPQRFGERTMGSLSRSGARGGGPRDHPGGHFHSPCAILPGSDPAGGCPQSLLSLEGPRQCRPSWTRHDCVFFCTVIIPLSSPPSLLTPPFN